MKFLPKYRAEVDCALVDFFAGQKFSEKNFSGILKYSTLLGGKRIRPIFGLLAFEISKNPRTKISRARALRILISLELIHASSLVHDDLPALDDDILRRGKSTTWKKFGEANAILAGDGLNFLAFENVAAKSPSEISAKLTAILSRASREMTVGQFRDLDSTKNNSLAKILETYRQKTGALISAAAEFGATLASADSQKTKLLREFAARIGLAFQIRDDLLDGGDGFVEILGVEKSEKKLSALTAAAIQISRKLKSKKLEQLAEFISTRER